MLLFYKFERIFSMRENVNIFSCTILFLCIVFTFHSALKWMYHSKIALKTVKNIQISYFSKCCFFLPKYSMYMWMNRSFHHSFTFLHTCSELEQVQKSWLAHSQQRTSKQTLKLFLQWFLPIMRRCLILIFAE